MNIYISNIGSLFFFPQLGQSTDTKGGTLEQKADSFKGQYLRPFVNDKLTFFLCKIKAKNSDVISIRDWEGEAIRQCDEFLGGFA